MPRCDRIVRLEKSSAGDAPTSLPNAPVPRIVSKSIAATRLSPYSNYCLPCLQERDEREFSGRIFPAYHSKRTGDIICKSAFAGGFSGGT